MDKAINEYLATFGLTDSNKPKFRLSWSDDQLESRKGTYREFYGSIYLRTVVGVKSVPKYPYIKSRWLLERWTPPHISFSDDLPDSRNGSYEPIYVFEDGKGNALPLSLRVIKLIMNAVINPRRVGERKMALEEELEKVDANEQSYYEDALEVSPITNALHMRQGIIRP